MHDEIDDIDDIDDMRERLREALDDVASAESRADDAERKLEAVGAAFDELAPATSQLLAQLDATTLREPNVFDAAVELLADLSAASLAFAGEAVDDDILEAEAHADLEIGISRMENGTHPLVLALSQTARRQ